MDKTDIIIKYVTGIEPMNLTRLHKILYFSQAASLINFGKRMFKEEIVTGDNGPFIPEVQKTYIYHSGKIRYEKEICDELDRLTEKTPESIKVEKFGKTKQGELIRVLLEETRKFSDKELCEKTKYSLWKRCYNSENKIMKPKDIMKFHKGIKGFDEKEKPSGKTYKATEISKFLIRKFENINPLSLMRILYFLNRDWKNEYRYNLFPEKIKIISSGPMVEEVYKKYRTLGSSKIFLKEEFEIDKADQDKIIGIVKKYPYNSSAKLFELFQEEKRNISWQDSKFSLK